VIGIRSLDGFAVGALLSGACALAIAIPRRRRRPPATQGDSTLSAERNGWLCEHVMAAETAGSGLAAQARGAGAERLAQQDELGARRKDRSPGRREGKAARGHRSGHRPRHAAA
jgi:hypothetical protein